MIMKTEARVRDEPVHDASRDHHVVAPVVANGAEVGAAHAAALVAEEDLVRVGVPERVRHRGGDARHVQDHVVVLEERDASLGPHGLVVEARQLGRHEGARPEIALDVAPGHRRVRAVKVRHFPEEPVATELLFDRSRGHVDVRLAGRDPSYVMHDLGVRSAGRMRK
jgi:hypothetical protein